MGGCIHFLLLASWRAAMMESIRLHDLFEALALNATLGNK